MKEKKKIKVLNLYAGIGGNRKLWPNNEIEITAVEYNREIAKIYQNFFPQDKVVIADAHQYLLDHYSEFDFIWSSPPCQSHSRINNLNYIKIEQGQKPKYPDMTLYQEIILLQHWFKGKFVVENVIGYYKPLINPFKYASHYFWSNFHIGNSKNAKRFIREHICDFTHLPKEYLNLKIKNKEQILNNMTEFKTGLHVFNCAFKERQETLSP